ncbi:hypothetical protein C8D88_113133 [Lentzea atacamensis]|uniref:Uncharacterized protein n=1 Tax=Lentzea atacamensis TaxID=531938 RepID=A0A316HPA7_9PSEU|nr:hypothetical protein [Lentzea atacamensis]PWK82540.1 hypothetical protein C8D88_113133 [Lentzea atacamensis]
MYGLFEARQNLVPALKFVPTCLRVSSMRTNAPRVVRSPHLYQASCMTPPSATLASMFDPATVIVRAVVNHVI